MSDNIPYEIQLEIIKKVSDVKSLIRCRAVSKLWRSFIDSSEFIIGYGARDTQPHRLLLRYKIAGEVKHLSFVDDDDDDTDIFTQQQDFAPNVTDLIKQMVLGNQGYPLFSEVIGSSCGLWCLHDYNTWETEMAVIWNPSIRKSVGVVVPPLLLHNTMNRFGFGVCPSTYDPTIVGISRCLGMTKRWQVQIFTLSSKTWKMIPSSNMPRETISLRPSIQVATNGFLFWVAYDKVVGNDGLSRYEDLILSFDLSTHDFKEVHLPVSIARASQYLSISKLNESLVVSAYTVEVNDELVYGVWMMGEEGGVMTSFTKLFNVSTPDTSIRRLLGFRKSGEPITETITKDEQAALEVYEPCSERFNNLGIYGKKGSFFISPCTEALLLIDHSDGCIISNDC